MSYKKVVLTIRNQNTQKTICGVLTEDVLQAVSVQTGLAQEDVLASLEWLSRIGIIEKEEAVMH